MELEDNYIWKPIGRIGPEQKCFNHENIHLSLSVSTDSARETSAHVSLHSEILQANRRESLTRINFLIQDIAWSRKNPINFRSLSQIE